MWESTTNNAAERVHQLAHIANLWLAKHLLNILIIVIGAYILQRLGIHLLEGVVKRTVRHDLFPTEAERKKRIETLNSLVGASMKVGTWVVAGIMIVSELGINTGPLLASAGFLGVAVGFGAQSLVKDFVSGIFIISENQYRVGDIVEIGNVSGVVEAITIRTTVLRSLDGNIHHVPNGSITVTTNKTSHYSRLAEELVFPIDTDIERIEHLINHIGEELASKPEYKNKILDPPRFYRIKSLDNDGVRVQILGTVTEGEQYQLKSDFYRSLIKALKHNDLEVITNQHLTVKLTKTSKA